MKFFAIATLTILLAGIASPTFSQEASFKVLSAYTESGQQIELYFPGNFRPNGEKAAIEFTYLVGCTPDTEDYRYGHSLKMVDDQLWLETSPDWPWGPQPAAAEKRTFKFTKTDHPWSSEALTIFSSDEDPFGLGESSTILVLPKSNFYTGGVGTAASCPDAGFYPNLIDVVIDVDEQDAFEEWALTNGVEIEQAAESDLGNFEVLGFDVASSYLNGWTLSVDTGKEVELLDDLLNQPWTIAAKRIGQAAGPSSVGVSFSKTLILSGSFTQSRVRSRLSDVLSDFFGSSLISSSYVALRGTSFEAKIAGPMKSLLPDMTEYSDYWVVANLAFDVFVRYHDINVLFLKISILDGFLPKWNEDTPPPNGHIAQAHLSPFGEGHLKDFTSLIALQNAFVNFVASEWNGTVEIPG